MNPPKIITDCVRIMRDERGKSWIMAAGPTLSVANSHTDDGPRWASEVVEEWLTGPPAACNIVRKYRDPIPHHLFLSKLPPPGTPVWQFRPGTDLVRTSYISTFTTIDSFVVAYLVAGGPFPGVPIQNDSGSGVWAVIDGRAVQVGVVNYGGTVSLPFWTRRLIGTKGTVLEPNLAAVPYTGVLQTPDAAAWYYGETADTEVVPKPPTPPTPPSDGSQTEIANLKSEIQQLKADLDALEKTNEHLGHELHAAEEDLQSLKEAFKTINRIIA
jgi:hypothetical protein